MSERKKESVINYLNTYFTGNEISQTTEYENTHMCEYYIGEYDADRLTFILHDKSYWNDLSEVGKKRIEQSPMVTIKDKTLKNNLDTLFSEQWIEGFKEWFNINFSHKINRIR